MQEVMHSWSPSCKAMSQFAVVEAGSKSSRKEPRIIEEIRVLEAILDTILERMLSDGDSDFEAGFWVFVVQCRGSRSLGCIVSWVVRIFRNKLDTLTFGNQR